MKIVFAGTPEFAAVALQAIHTAGIEIALVLTQPDRPAGRGMQLHESAVKQFAVSRGIPVAQPISLRLDGKYPDVARDAHALLCATPHDIMVVAAYGLILPPSVLAIAPRGCLNIHASLLPRWRGAAPIHRAIEAGDSQTGITIMQMEQGLDTGPMLDYARLPILSDDTTGSLHDRLARLGGEMIVTTLRRLADGALHATPQPETGVTYASKITKHEAALDFSQAADVLGQKIRAFNPAPGASMMIDGVTIKLWRAELAATTTGASPGQIIGADDIGGLVIACGNGALRMLELQKPGGKRLPAREFLRSLPIPVGATAIRTPEDP
jgi:methionyl-tRNA formyltransferase